jgi:hypothetical protein
MNLETYSFEMYTKSGDNACRSIVRAAWKKIESKKRVTEKEIRDYVESRMVNLYSAGKHKEIWDTEPRDHIFYLVTKKAREIGYNFNIS